MHKIFLKISQELNEMMIFITLKIRQTHHWFGLHALLLQIPLLVDMDLNVSAGYGILLFLYAWQLPAVSRKMAIFAMFLIVVSSIWHDRTANVSPDISLQKKPQTICGYILDYSSKSRAQEWIIQSPNHHRVKIKLSKRNHHSSAQHTMPNSAPQPGDCWCFQGWIRPPAEKTWEGGFSEKEWLNQLGIHAIMQASQAGACAKQELCGPPPSIVYRVKLAMNRQRQKLSEFFVRASGPVTGELLSALLLGEKAELNPELRERFRLSGMMHILAISGFHFAFLAAILHIALGFLPVSLTSRRIISIILLGLYAIFTGLPASVCRAWLMFTLWMSGAIANRSSAWPNTLALSAFLILLIDPYQWNSPGFQLSYCATLAILFAVSLHKNTPPFLVKNPWRKRTDKFLFPLWLSMCAIAGTAPISIPAFQWIAPVSLIAGYFVVPLTMLLLSNGLILSIWFVLTRIIESLAEFSPIANDGLNALTHAVTTFLGSGCKFWTDLCLGFLQRLNQIPGAGFSVYFLSELWYVLFWGILILTPPVYQKQRGASQCLTIFFIVWLGLFGGNILWHTANSPLTVAWFDVDQGDAAVIISPQGHSLLIDTGPSTGYSRAVRNTILPWLRSRGIDSLDAVLITHAHADHYGGLTALSDSIPVKQLIGSHCSLKGSRAWQKARSHALKHGARETLVKRGESILLGSLYLHVLSPSRENSCNDQNNASIVLAMNTWGTSWFFMGDLEHQQEAEIIPLIQNNTDMAQNSSGNQMRLNGLGDTARIGILKAGHHGSKSSSSIPWLRATDPEFAVISAGKHNRYQHPHEQALQRLKQQQAEIHETSRCGTIVAQQGRLHTSISPTRDKECLDIKIKIPRRPFFPD